MDLTGARFRSDRPRLLRHRCDGSDARDRPEQVDEVGQVVRRHVEDRPTAHLVIEIGRGMPALVAWAHEVGGARHRLADLSGIDQPPAGLMRATEKGVWRRTNAEPLLGRCIDQLLAVLEANAQWLFAVDMLARRDRVEPHLDVRLGHREIQDDLDRRVGEQVVDADGLQAELFGARLGRSGGRIGEPPDVEDRKALRCLQIGARDDAAAYDTDSDSFHFSSRADELPRLRGRTGPVVFQGAP